MVELYMRLLFDLIETLKATFHKKAVYASRDIC